MESVKQQIELILQKAIKDLTGLEIVPKLSHPSNQRHGDYSTNVAMILFKDKGLRIKDKKYATILKLAEAIVEKLNNSSLIINHCSQIEVWPPGFINFWLSRNYLITLMIYIIRVKEEYGKSERLGNKKILVEFAHPNTHKEFHIGHLRNIILGESICRLLEANGANVNRVNYQGDVGLHVAKALFGLLRLCHADQTQPDWASQILKNKILKRVQDDNSYQKAKFLGKAYTSGSKSYEEEKSAKAKIIVLNKKIYSKDPSILPLWGKTRQWSLDYFDSIYKRVGTQFKRLYFESEVYEAGKKIVLSHVDDGIFEKSDNAIIFDGEKFGLHKRVFITKEGNTTYEGKEMGLGHLQYKEFPFDEVLHIVGPEQAGYFRVVFKALDQIDAVFKNKEKHLSYGFVQLKQGKMSSRMGNVVSGEWLLDEAKLRIRKEFKKMDEETSEKVAVGSVKYSMLKFARESNIQFSFEDSISLEGNSGPYLQYAYARTQSVVRKSEILNSKFETNSNDQNTKLKNYKFEPEEVLLLRSLNRFQEVVMESAETFAPNLLCNYLFDLSQKFNLFYQKHKILESENRELRLALTMAVGQVIKNGLYLLGISASERM
ncbi:MAG: arginine--tRNA ligase [Patescibacteria group bacterium]